MSKLARIRGHSFLDRLGENPRILDLGANDGGFAREILDHRPGARVLLVEPDPLLVGIITRRWNRDPRIAVFSGLIGPQSAPLAAFHLCKIPEGNSVHLHFTQAWSAETRPIQVEMISLPALLALAQWREVDLVKMDIEGAEWDVLLSLAPQDLAGVAQLSVEFHDFIDPTQRPRTEACIEHLHQMGFESICRAGTHHHGSPYFDCLFYRE